MSAFDATKASLHGVLRAQLQPRPAQAAGTAPLRFTAEQRLSLYENGCCVVRGAVSPAAVGTAAADTAAPPAHESAHLRSHCQSRLFGAWPLLATDITRHFA